MIRQRNLSLLSNRLYQEEGGRRISEELLERDYCISWFLVGLSRSSLKDTLSFKGGTAIKKCYISDYRFSEDLDFTMVGDIPIEDVVENFEVAFKQTQNASGVRLNFAQARDTHVNSYTLYILYEGPISRTYPKRIKVDITMREQFTFPFEDKPVLKGYDEYEDLPNNANICVYSLNEIATEKVVALFDRARNEPRDLYDLGYLTSNAYVNLSDLVEAVAQKLHFRGKGLTSVKDEFLRKEHIFKISWESRLSYQMTHIPEFNQVYRGVQRELRQAGLLR